MTKNETKNETKKRIKELKNRLQEECKKENSDIKRITFLKATINLYCKSIGLEEPYKW